MKLATSTLAALALVATGTANAAVYTVGAYANSSSGGTPLDTITLTAGHLFAVTASTNDLWSAGALPRYSDANGLVANRYATAADDSGQPVGTLIGENFGLFTENGFSAPYGALVGQIGSTYTLLGTNFRGPAAATGTLRLLFWDSNYSDNSGTIAATVTAVPDAAVWVLMVAGFGLVGASLRHRREGRAAA